MHGSLIKMNTLSLSLISEEILLDLMKYFYVFRVLVKEEHFVITLENVFSYWYSLEAHRRSASNEYPKPKKNIENSTKYPRFIIKYSVLTSHLVFNL